jgi:competence protein ComEC
MAPFLDAVAPSIAIISAGYENSFGHPHPDVVRRLQERHVTILRTDDDGLVTVRTDGRNLAFDSMAWGIPGFGPPAPFDLSPPPP